MIHFKTIRWKNLLSTGNAFTEIKLNETQNALIVGENGAGKSTILDALCFALFGKAFRKINKPLLVNSVNEKGCEVQIEFEINGKNFKVVRGIKPNIFEIYCDGTLLNQDSASKDYQEYLEKIILKMNYKSFTQIVILGSASFTPFMQLSPADRRAVIEDLLDIQIFSSMNVLVKQRFLENKTALEHNRVSLIGKEEKKVFIEKTLASLKSNNEDRLSSLTNQIQTHRTEDAKLSEEIDTLLAQREQMLNDVSTIDSLRTKHKKLIALQSQIETNLKNHQLDHKFYLDNDSCPTCRQAIAQTFKAEEISVKEMKITDLKDGLKKIGIEIDKVINSITEMDKIIAKIGELQSDISVRKSSQSFLREKIIELESETDRLQNADKILIDSRNDLETVNSEIDALNAEKTELIENRQYIETAIMLLKDGGIKTKIVKQYLPIINKHINKYLAQMGFFVNFNINEQFEETIKSRYRDEFSYQNFSEGEKTRIDLALLFTWRAIAKMRNSVNTNLLVLDEVLDGSLDNNGTDEFLKIMWNVLNETNTFVISHKTDAMIDKFQKIYRFTKVKNFSKMTT